VARCTSRQANGSCYLDLHLFANFCNDFTNASF
jgi:hypothetical protein